MGRQIIKQPNGKYAQWSSIVDDFVMFDATPEEILDDWLHDERARLTIRLQQIIADLDAGGKPYYQFTMSWNEAIREVYERHGTTAETWGILQEIDPVSAAEATAAPKS